MVDAAPDTLCGVASVASVALGVQREVNEAGIVGGDGWRGGGRGGGEGRGGEGRGGGELTLSHILVVPSTSQNVSSWSSNSCQDLNSSLCFKLTDNNRWDRIVSIME